MPRSIKPVSQRLDDLNLRVLTWENLVSEGGLEPPRRWYIPELGIHHHPKLTQPRAVPPGIPQASSGGTAGAA
jgi:hypothetical protein